MKRVLLVGTLLAPVVIIACSGRAPESAPAEAPRAVNAPPLEDYHNGLSDGERQEFYHLSEGGEILPLALLRALKRPRTPQDWAATAWCPSRRTSNGTASSPTARAARIHSAFRPA
jgi:hypothetical protein